LFSFTLNHLQAEEKKSETVVIKTKIYCDHCMQCGSCSSTIYSAVKKAGGIKFTSINPEKNTITVTYKPALTTPDKIRKALSEAGFDADDIKAIPQACEKLDDCCKLH
jgi:copper chaperone CopZ